MILKQNTLFSGLETVSLCPLVKHHYVLMAVLLQSPNAPHPAQTTALSFPESQLSIHFNKAHQPFL